MDHPDIGLWWKNRRRGFHFGIMWYLIQTALWLLVYDYHSGLLVTLDTVIKMSYGVSIALIVMYYVDAAVGEFKTVDEMKHPDPKVWWKNRRMGFYVGIVWGSLQTLMWIFVAKSSDVNFDDLTNVIGSSYSVVFILIMSYYGNTTAEQFAQKVGK